SHRAHLFQGKPVAREDDSHAPLLHLSRAPTLTHRGTPPRRRVLEESAMAPIGPPAAMPLPTRGSSTICSGAMLIVQKYGGTSVGDDARIRSIDDAKLRESLRKKEIAVVAGFQGIDEHGNITTLGRGGSDTTAVALAAALKADACEIYTDVDGVYTTDPRVCERARKLERISYEE